MSEILKKRTFLVKFLRLCCNDSAVRLNERIFL